MICLRCLSRDIIKISNDKYVCQICKCDYTKHEYDLYTYYCNTTSEKDKEELGYNNMNILPKERWYSTIKKGE